MHHYAGHYYHVYNRGVEKRKLFSNEGNYQFLLRKLKEYFPGTALTMIAYCLMPNHYHLLIRVEEDGALSPFIQRVFNSYVQAFNRQQKRSGTLFESRVKNKLIDNNKYFFHIPRYIHLNPVKAGLVPKPEDWPYSNYQEFIGVRNNALYSKNFVAEQFNSPKRYKEFVDGYISPDAELYLKRLELEK